MPNYRMPKILFAMSIFLFSFPGPDKHWLVAGMRLPLLWEHDGPETVVSIDIHDDIRVQNRQISKLLRVLDERKCEGKEIAMTYWQGRDKVCQNGSSLPHGRHNHFDAGLCLWRPGKARLLARKVGSFVEYCCRVLDRTGTLVRPLIYISLVHPFFFCGC